MTSTEIRDMLLDPPHFQNAPCSECGKTSDLYAPHVMHGDGKYGPTLATCAPCWRSIAAKQSAPRPSAPVQWHRQKQLLTGLDCAPGQGDLFDTNGSK